MIYETVSRYGLHIFIIGMLIGTVFGCNGRAWRHCVALGYTGRYTMDGDRIVCFEVKP